MSATSPIYRPGHPRHDAGACGRVRALGLADGALSAELDQLGPAFREAVQAGRYKKVSASFYRPDAPANPKPGQAPLRHVGFLGAEVPAVKGLAPVNLADGAGDVVTVDFGEAASDAPAPSPTQTETQPVPEAPTPMPTATDLARRFAEVEARRPNGVEVSGRRRRSPRQGPAQGHRSMTITGPAIVIVRDHPGEVAQPAGTGDTRTPARKSKLKET